MNLSPYCNPNREQPYQLNVDWQSDRHAFIVGIWIVYHVDSCILRDRLKSQGPTCYEETRAMIQKNLSGSSEDEIATDSLKVSLICPVSFVYPISTKNSQFQLSRVKMSLPARSKDCSPPHLQCFDLHNYLMMNEKRPNWKCPVCAKLCSYSALMIDK